MNYLESVWVIGTQLVLVFSQTVEYRSTDWCECVSGDCRIKTHVSGRSDHWTIRIPGYH